MPKQKVKIPKGNFQVQTVALAAAKKVIGKGCLCCVLISCSEPGPDGNIQVEMQFDGDETLASFLVANASQIFEDRFLEKESSYPNAGNPS